jgi:CPA2 family monovalent cation:H+ antiporter-2
MEIDPILPVIVGVTLAAFVAGITLRLLKQPYVIGYIVVGVILGALGFGGGPLASQIANLGIVLLLFFIGMHVSVPKLVSNWRVAILGTSAQIVITVLLVLLANAWFGWSLQRVLLVGFMISLSSTAVILKILEDWKELDTKVGQNVLGILLVQDLAIIPMIMLLELTGGDGLDLHTLGLQLAGGILLIGIVIYFMVSPRAHLPFAKAIRGDHELQVFVALAFCFGLALLAGIFSISVALGAFVAGIIISAAKETHWVAKSLGPFHVIFVALFFIYIGTLLDIVFLREHALLIIGAVLVVLLLNTLLNTLILRILGDSWRESIFAGALLSQIGEFSFLLAAIAFSAGILLSFDHQFAISVITVSLLLSPLWIQTVKRLLHIDASYVFETLRR